MWNLRNWCNFFKSLCMLFILFLNQHITLCIVLVHNMVFWYLWILENSQIKLINICIDSLIFFVVGILKTYSFSNFQEYKTVIHVLQQINWTYLSNQLKFSILWQIFPLLHPCTLQIITILISISMNLTFLDSTWVTSGHICLSVTYFININPSWFIHET